MSQRAGGESRGKTRNGRGGVSPGTQGPEHWPAHTAPLAATRAMKPAGKPVGESRPGPLVRHTREGEMAEAKVDWAQPRTPDLAEQAFPTGVNGWLPEWDEIPKHFRDDWFYGRTPYVKAVSDWFYKGPERDRLTPKDGIDEDTALRHLHYCLGSFAPKHERKIAGCAYLLSLWFEEPRTPPDSENDR